VRGLVKSNDVKVIEAMKVAGIDTRTNDDRKLTATLGLTSSGPVLSMARQA